MIIIIIIIEWKMEAKMVSRKKNGKEPKQEKKSRTTLMR